MDKVWGAVWIIALLGAGPIHAQGISKGAGSFPVATPPWLMLKVRCDSWHLTRRWSRLRCWPSGIRRNGPPAAMVRR